MQLASSWRSTRHLAKRVTARRVLSTAANMEYSADAVPRNTWTAEEVEHVYNMPVLDLVYRAATVHRMHFNSQEVQKCTLLSIKTGGCPEDCSYCPQASKHKDSPVEATKQLDVDTVLDAAREAKGRGSTRFCMGGAWREVRGKWGFKQILKMVTGVRAMDMEVCCTLGMISPEQAEQLKEAGLTAYNHNLDTSRDHYKKIITTRTYDDRLNTLQNVRDAGLSVCCGGIIGLGEAHEDRMELLRTLATLPEHPESVPVNALVAVEGTPLEDMQRVPTFELVRMIAAARVIMPKSMVRLSAGRVSLSVAEQALCFMAGANSIFTGEKLLTTANNDKDMDETMFELFGLRGKKPFIKAEAVA